MRCVKPSQTCLGQATTSHSIGRELWSAYSIPQATTARAFQLINVYPRYNYHQLDIDEVPKANVDDQLSPRIGIHSDPAVTCSQRQPYG